MEGQRSRNQWLNPLFRSETNSTVCSSKSAPSSTTAKSSNTHSEKDMKRLIGCISESWKTIKSMPSASSFASREEKEVVMEGYLPTTKRSILNFLKVFFGLELPMNVFRLVFWLSVPRYMLKLSSRFVNSSSGYGAEAEGRFSGERNDYNSGCFRDNRCSLETSVHQVGYTIVKK